MERRETFRTQLASNLKKVFTQVIDLLMTQMKEKNYYVYIITNKHNTVLYVGVTNNLVR